jgi:Fe-S cluster assembly protein SufD
MSIKTVVDKKADDRFLPVTWAAQEADRLERSVGQSPVFAGVREQALKLISAKGLPTTRVEDWKYTNAQSIAKQPHVINGGVGSANKADIDALSVAKTTLVIINGRYSPELSRGVLPEGLEAAGLCEALTQPSHPLNKVASESLGKIAPFADDQIVAFNAALARDGIVIRVKKNAQISDAVELLFISNVESERSASFPRVLIVSEPFSKAEIVETYFGAAGKEYLTSAVTEIELGEEAELVHDKLQLEGDQATHFGRIQVRQGRASRFSSRVYNFGGRLVRNEVNPLLDGEGIDTTLYGLTVITDSQHVDNHTTLDHAKPNSQSTEIYKGIYGGKSRGVFCGTIIVRQDAQKTNAIQSNNALLLSDEAEIDSKPQLTIYADDVKCTHGATVGQLDEQSLLIRAFAGEIVSREESPEINSLIERTLEERLGSML